MKTKAILKFIAVLLAVATAFPLCAGFASAETCFHETAKGLVKTDGGYVSANVCTLCGKAVTELGSIDSSSEIELYKDTGKSELYSKEELEVGFASA